MATQEFLDRPTAPAHWWATPHENVLAGRDLQRETQGTWLGITKQGRLAVLTNFREDEPITEERSRGEIPKSYLTTPLEVDESPEEFAKRLVGEIGVRGIGGFSLLFGQLHTDPSIGLTGSLGIVSNRTADAESVTWLADKKDQKQNWTHALSNDVFGERGWPKVDQSQQLLNDAIESSVESGESEDAFIARLFEILSIDQLPRRKPGQPWSHHTREHRYSIFIPPTSSSDNDTLGVHEKAAGRIGQRAKVGYDLYGTQKQTVLLVDKVGKATFVERTLFDNNAKPVAAGETDRRIDFLIEPQR